MVQSSKGQDRRRFLKAGGAVAAGMLMPSAGVADTTTQKPYALPLNPKTHDAMPTRNLGKTGYKVGIFSLGG